MFLSAFRIFETDLNIRKNQAFGSFDNNIQGKKGFERFCQQNTKNKYVFFFVGSFREGFWNCLTCFLDSFQSIFGGDQTRVFGIRPTKTNKTNKHLNKQQKTKDKLQKPLEKTLLSATFRCFLQLNSLKIKFQPSY